MDILQGELFLAIAAGVGGFLLYLLKRKFEKKPEFELLEVFDKVLSINSKMEDQGLDITKVKDIKDRLLSKEVSRIKISQEIVEKDHTSIENEGSHDRKQSNIELIQQSAAQGKAAFSRMEEVLSKMEFRLGAEQFEAVLESQKKWQEYCDRAAEAIAMRYEGGTHYPLALSNELLSLINERTARLTAEWEDLEKT